MISGDLLHGTVVPRPPDVTRAELGSAGLVREGHCSPQFGSQQ